MANKTLELYYNMRRLSERLKTKEGFSEDTEYTDAIVRAIEKDFDKPLIAINRTDEHKTKRAKSNFRPKICEGCKTVFTPTGTRSRWCTTCEKPWQERQRKLQEAEEQYNNTTEGTKQ